MTQDLKTLKQYKEFIFKDHKTNEKINDLKCSLCENKELSIENIYNDSTFSIMKDYYKYTIICKKCLTQMDL